MKTREIIISIAFALPITLITISISISKQHGPAPYSREINIALSRLNKAGTKNGDKNNPEQQNKQTKVFSHCGLPNSPFGPVQNPWEQKSKAPAKRIGG